ncbi:hypothetical protein BT69DRAFT_455749 [Atractiella rhizophila]|nr:hypothetical protein BT69DRAFT_455749 [Atractiella rhizophila]
MKLLRWSYLSLALAQEWEAQNDVELGEIGIPAQVKYRAEPFSYEYSDFEESFAGLLGKRQTYVCTKSGYAKCVYYNYCCRLGVGNKCCGNNICCPSGYGCCDGKGCYPDGYQCCKGGTYCDPGWNCYTYASGTPGCCPSGYSPCSSLDGCCPTGSTCYVDTNGNKKCRTYGSVPTYSEETRTFSRAYFVTHVMTKAKMKAC